MAYSTPAMLRDAVYPSGDGTQPAQPTRTAADLTDDQLSDFIAEADAQIDSYIGGRYVVPVAEVAGATPHPVDYWSRNLAAYFATLSYRGSADFTDQDPIARRFNATMDALKLVASGGVKLQLPENFGPNAGVGAGTAINPTYSGDLFDARDFNLHPLNPSWPLWPDNPGWRTW